MGRRPAPHVVRSPRWVCVQVGLRCEEQHQIQAFDWALVWPRRPDGLRLVYCEAHANAKGYHRQGRPVVLRRDDGQDVRSRQSGDDS